MGRLYAIITAVQHIINYPVALFLQYVPQLDKYPIGYKSNV